MLCQYCGDDLFEDETNLYLSTTHLTEEEEEASAEYMFQQMKHCERCGSNNLVESYLGGF